MIHLGKSGIKGLVKFSFIELRTTMLNPCSANLSAEDNILKYFCLTFSEKRFDFMWIDWKKKIRKFSAAAVTGTLRVNA